MSTRPNIFKTPKIKHGELLEKCQLDIGMLKIHEKIGKMVKIGIYDLGTKFKVRLPHWKLSKFYKKFTDYFADRFAGDFAGHFAGHFTECTWSASNRALVGIN